MVWFRVGAGVLVHGVKGGLGPKLQGSQGTGQHPQHCQHHPQDADDAGEWGPYHWGGGGGTWPRDWYIYIYIYIYVYKYIHVYSWIMCVYHTYFMVGCTYSKSGARARRPFMFLRVMVLETHKLPRCSKWLFGFMWFSSANATRFGELNGCHPVGERNWFLSKAC